MRLVTIFTGTERTRRLLLVPNKNTFDVHTFHTKDLAPSNIVSLNSCLVEEITAPDSSIYIRITPSMVQVPPLCLQGKTVKDQKKWFSALKDASTTVAPTAIPASPLTKSLSNSVPSFPLPDSLASFYARSPPGVPIAKVASPIRSGARIAAVLKEAARTPDSPRTRELKEVLTKSSPTNLLDAQQDWKSPYPKIETLNKMLKSTKQQMDDELEQFLTNINFAMVKLRFLSYDADSVGSYSIPGTSLECSRERPEFEFNIARAFRLCPKDEQTR